jgi:2-iminoacetate synthase ThiH
MRDNLEWIVSEAIEVAMQMGRDPRIVSEEHIERHFKSIHEVIKAQMERQGYRAMERHGARTWIRENPL